MKSPPGKHKTHKSSRAWAIEEAIPQSSITAPTLCMDKESGGEKWEKVRYFKLLFVMTPFDSPQLCENPLNPFPKPSFQLAKPIKP